VVAKESFSPPDKPPAGGRLHLCLGECIVGEAFVKWINAEAMQWRRVTTSLPLLFLAMASCSLEQKDEVNCRGADGLAEEHAAILACAGWLNYVKEHVCTVEYVNIIPDENPDIKVYGRATCSEAKILVTNTARVMLLGLIEQIKVATTIVHEAAHLEDQCRAGEEPAVEAEDAFLVDLCTKARAREEGCWENIRNTCLRGGS